MPTKVRQYPIHHNVVLLSQEEIKVQRWCLRCLACNGGQSFPIPPLSPLLFGRYGWEGGKRHPATLFFTGNGRHSLQKCPLRKTYPFFFPSGKLPVTSGSGKAIGSSFSFPKVIRMRPATPGNVCQQMFRLDRFPSEPRSVPFGRSSAELSSLTEYRKLSLCCHWCCRLRDACSCCSHSQSWNLIYRWCFGTSAKGRRRRTCGGGSCGGRGGGDPSHEPVPF